MIFRSIGLFGRYQDAAVKATLSEVRSHLEQRGRSVFLGDTTHQEIKGLRIGDTGKALAETVDLGIVVGGDGTMLHVANALARVGLPVIGINMGRLGFLTDIPADTFREDLDAMLDGQYEIEERMMLKAGLVRAGEVHDERLALNDVVLSKGATGKMIEFDTRVNGEAIGRVRGDGVIVATPTGSTAYALSAGGPILHPLLPAIVLTPICPHTLGQRPIVLDGHSAVEIEFVGSDNEQGHTFVDGLDFAVADPGDTLRITRAELSARLVRIKGHSHYEALHSKLGWG
ncbi:MAG TPA: NAD kinase [Gammaproteobacteria bacterium]|jgi:NAD+ kinase|nr:NAD kinase [Acidiferrobacteraceae bacterium]MDP6399644.1 NAD(+)/NADH kinase [Arenicellales bacterium]HCX87704.1 NAD kinase [Gammaproteobacteria bacterium]MDP6551017.1 NAD(+)/NADH kinase [Arenicellales bacterium]MDP6792270.1 NAD(+)/NADH kinase [Arenicellales bacterium]|tara:strand:+ start:3900 stop:4760 length:861 start_codon:yes stop_codon:yes gene_type:complete